MKGRKVTQVAIEKLEKAAPNAGLKSVAKEGVCRSPRLMERSAVT